MRRGSGIAYGSEGIRTSMSRAGISMSGSLSYSKIVDTVMGGATSSVPGRWSSACSASVVRSSPESVNGISSRSETGLEAVRPSEGQAAGSLGRQDMAEGGSCFGREGR